MKLNNQTLMSKQASKQKNKNQENTMQPLPSLPEDMIHEILCKLPAKSLSRFRCVCKPWNIQVADPIFFNSSNKFTFIVRHGINKLYSLEYDNSSTPLSRFQDEGIKQIRHPFSFPNHNIIPNIIDVKILGSCKGLACLSYFFNSCHLPCIWNPYTEEYKVVPISTALNPYRQYVDVRANGFGHDDNANEYIFINFTGSRVGRLGYPGSIVSAYSLKSNSWKQSLYIPYEFPFDKNTHTTPGLFCSGAFHWFAKSILEKNASSSEVLIALDVGTGVVQEIPQPGSLDFDDKYVDVLGGCLVILCSTKTESFEVWLMKDYGVRESWIKIYNIPRLMLFDVEPVVQCLRRIKCLKNGQIILEIEYYKTKRNTATILILHDLKDGHRRALKFGEDIFNCVSYKPLNLETYVKSLVSLKWNTYVGNIEQEAQVVNEELAFSRQIYEVLIGMHN
ncbi:F-box/kelch-repeat protein At3g23880-like [Papaver somniferum]|uniref:F-box/kelch-repeat protein At3g23880-like n=1 Tax=Papaver somniferum TaxID=3469 RepID=UPI000E7020E0|nr:F-box/kelch-repeat protein At3g23880-like [Papaver somniferum]